MTTKDKLRFRGPTNIEKPAKSTVLFVLSLIIMIQPSPIAYSLDPSDYQRYSEWGGGLNFYDKDSCKTGDSSGSNSINLNGKDNLEKIYNFFIGRGLKDLQAAGIVGNIIHENAASGRDADPTIVEIHPELPERTRDPASLPQVSWPGGGVRQPGWGLVQWTPAGKVIQFQKASGISGDIAELGTQLQIIWWDMTENDSIMKNNMDAFRSTTTVEEAAYIFLTKYERPASPESSRLTRETSAKLVLETYNKNPSSGGVFDANTGCLCYDSSTSAASEGSKSYKLPSQNPPFVQATARIVGSKFNLTNIYGWRDDPPYHSSGLALDLMVSDVEGKDNSQATMKSIGDPMFEYLKANAGQLHIKSMIWQQTYYEFTEGKLSYSNKMEDRGGITANHYDHIHADFNPDVRNLSSPTTLAEGASGDNCGSGAVAGDFVRTALNYAWAEKNHQPKLEMKPEYKEAVDKAIANGKFVGGTVHKGIDCGGFITRAIQDSGVDPDYGDMGGTIAQEGYMKKNPDKYELVNATSTADLLPGDIFINNSHTYLWVGEQEGFGSTVAEASLDDYAPMAGGSGFDNKGLFNIYRIK